MCPFASEPLIPKSLTHVVFGDASFASPKQLASFQGTMVFATTPQLQNNKVAPLSPLTWSSKKISRVVRSTLSAEAFSHVTQYRQNGMVSSPMGHFGGTGI